MPNIKKIIVSGSAISQLSNDAGYALNTAVTAVSGGLSTRITTNESNISTQTSRVNSLEAATSSYALKTDISGAFTAVSTSLASRTTTLEGSGSIQGVGTANNVTFANVTATGNVSIAGTLFVDGTTTTINSTNLNIEDKFILLNSGSTGSPESEGGIVVQSGSNGTGNAFYWDQDTTRWSVKAGASAAAGGLDADAFMTTVILGTTASVQAAGTYYKAGNIVIDGEDIFIIDNAALVS